MTNTEARQVIRKLFSLLPAAKSYWGRMVADADKPATFAIWAESLERYPLDAAERGLRQLAVVDPNNQQAVTYPLRTLIDLIDQETPRPVTVFAPCDRTARQTNMLESFLAACAAVDDPERLGRVLEAVQ